MVIQYFHMTFWIMTIYHQAKFGCQKNHYFRRYSSHILIVSAQICNQPWIPISDAPTYQIWLQKVVAVQKIAFWTEKHGDSNITPTGFPCRKYAPQQDNAVCTIQTDDMQCIYRPPWRQPAIALLMADCMASLGRLMVSSRMLRE